MTEPTRLGSTYRLQLNGMGFTGARALVPYLHRLGIETLYVSPVLAAAPGSSHGYDVIDPGRLDPQLGSAEEFAALLDELGTHDMRMLLDIVPNHMAAVPSNTWWWETLRQGEAAPDAVVFDIDWSQHGGKVLLPLLSQPLAAAVGGASVCDDPEGPALLIERQRLPLAPGTQSGGAMAGLVAAQHFRPAYWRLGDTAGNYRRFFNIDGLVGVRVEDPSVFARTHDLILRLCADPRIAGVRVDHIDGLWDPAGYLARLGSALDARGQHPLILVEKIVQRGESVEQRWAVDGTTGYEFADHAGGLFLEDSGCRELSELGSVLTGETATFAQLGAEAKREMLDRTFSAQLDRVARLAMSALDETHRGHDLSITDVRRGVEELTVALDVYRTYLHGGPAASVDANTIGRAVAQRAKDPRLEPEVERAVARVAQGLLEHASGESPWLHVAMRWQQLTGAVMAKGVEDTATYRYNGLLSHAEVGCDPDRSVCRPDAFHSFMRARGRISGPAGLNSTSTHDSKRNEDARCRLAALSEASAEWSRLVRRWHRRFATAGATPHPHDEIVAHQTLLALWPATSAGPRRADLDRIHDYILKAAREAKRSTSWTEPNACYERTLRSYVARVVSDDHYRAEMGRFVRGIAPTAVTNSLALAVLKTCAPGVPDFFQGSELFEATLTDPDNRRAVDFLSRDVLLRSLPPSPSEAGVLEAQVSAMLTDWPSGLLKLHIIRTLLHLRREFPDVFDKGAYAPYVPAGPRAENVVAWSRRRGKDAVIALVPRLMLRHAGKGRFPIGPRVWGKTTCHLPSNAPRSYVDVLTGRTLQSSNGRIEVAHALELLPVAVLREA